MKKAAAIVAGSAALLLAAGARCFFLWQEGLLALSRPPHEPVPIRGHVSAYQGASAGPR